MSKASISAPQYKGECLPANWSAGMSPESSLNTAQWRLSSPLEALGAGKSNFLGSLTLIIKAAGLGQLFTSWMTVLPLAFICLVSSGGDNGQELVWVEV